MRRTMPSGPGAVATCSLSPSPEKYSTAEARSMASSVAARRTILVTASAGPSAATTRRAASAMRRMRKTPDVENPDDELKPTRRLMFDEGVEDMIAPGAVDFEIGAGKALALEAVAFEQAYRGDVLRQAGRLDAVQAKRRKTVPRRRRDRARHAPLAGIARAHPIAECRCLRDAAADAADGQAAEQRVG